jgi:hypothetical protein
MALIGGLLFVLPKKPSFSIIANADANPTVCRNDMDINR